MASAPVFPGYRVLGTLGHGGMGQVYLAEDEMLARKVAIKTILPAVSGEGEHRARFLREARAMARLHSPRTVTVYDFGQAEDGTLYLAMELLTGESLEAVLDRDGRLPWRRAAQVAAAVAESLAEAHDRGVFHRDLKPANI